jgi:hypothetical protein
MSTKQPVWQLVANLGDRNPVDYDGYFILRDLTGVYPCEAEYLARYCDDPSGEDEDEDRGIWRAYRFPLERCTYIAGILSDNRFHPEHAAWFADDLEDVAHGIGADVDTLITDLCSEDPIDLAVAYQAIADYHGYENFDSYPLTFTSRREVEERYARAQYQEVTQ